MESNSLCNHTSDKQNLTTAEWESDLSYHEYDLDYRQNWTTQSSIITELIITITKIRKKNSAKQKLLKIYYVFQERPKQSEKYSALVEYFNEKETASFQSQWEAFNSAKHARSLPEKKKLLKAV